MVQGFLFWFSLVERQKRDKTLIFIISRALYPLRWSAYKENKMKTKKMLSVFALPAHIECGVKAYVKLLSFIMSRAPILGGKTVPRLKSVSHSVEPTDGVYSLDTRFRKFFYIYGTVDADGTPVHVEIRRMNEVSGDFIFLMLQEEELSAIVAESYEKWEAFAAAKAAVDAFLASVFSDFVSEKTEQAICVAAEEQRRKEYEEAARDNRPW